MALNRQFSGSYNVKLGKEHLDMPDLRLLPTDSLLLHEFADEKRVSRLEARLQADGYMKNPPIVAPVPGTDRFVVLDGANRVSAVRRIGCPHILAQVVEYDSDRVRLYTWYHLVTGRASDTFMDQIKSVPGVVVEKCSLKKARTLLSEQAIVAYIVTPPPRPGGEPPVYTVDGIPGTDHHNPEGSTVLLNSVVDTYKNDPHVSIHRASTDDLHELGGYYDDVAGLVVFPPYTPEGIVRLAEAGTYVPTGITRHIISHRALRVNVPMALLCSHASLDEKNAWWHEQVKRKLAANEIRLYQESTYLFDE